MLLMISVERAFAFARVRVSGAWSSWLLVFARTKLNCWQNSGLLLEFVCIWHVGWGESNSVV